MINDKTTTTKCSGCGHHAVAHTCSEYKATKEDAERFAEANRVEGSDGWQLMADFAAAVSGKVSLGRCVHCACPEFVGVKGEFTCLRRLETAASVPAELSDYWFEKKWADKADYFPDNTKPPRTCSYCGGVNPDDAISMLMQGWEVERTTKSYKRYLHPKGYAEYIRNLINRIPGLSDSDRFRSPVPPVKLYVQHFSDEQIDELNKIPNEI